MSWIRDHTLSWLQRLSLAVLRGGPIPHHVAIIMDGNRRFAVKSNMRKVEGHSKGFDKLSEVLQWCLDIGIYEVTVYAFSIENFKRTKEEVDQVLKLADEKFAKLLEEKDKLKELGIRVRVIGNMDLLPDTLKAKIAEATLETKDHDKAVLNVALAYTSRDEMTHSMISILDGIERGELTESDVDDHLLSKCLYTNERPTADLLIRTSGETRISDFLLWQVSNQLGHLLTQLLSQMCARVAQYSRLIVGLQFGNLFHRRTVARVPVLALVAGRIPIPAGPICRQIVCRIPTEREDVQ